MRLPDRLWLAAALAAPPAVVAAVLLVLASDHDRHPAASLATGLFIGSSFVGSGLVAWWRRPDNHTGRLLALVGFTFFLSALAEANDPRLFTAGIVVNALPIAALVHLRRESFGQAHAASLVGGRQRRQPRSVRDLLGARP